jgi:hypothetical protein
MMLKGVFSAPTLLNVSCLKNVQSFLEQMSSNCLKTFTYYKTSFEESIHFTDSFTYISIFIFKIKKTSEDDCLLEICAMQSMETASTSGTSLKLFQTTWCNIPEDSHHQENLKFHQKHFFKVCLEKVPCSTDLNWTYICHKMTL